VTDPVAIERATREALTRMRAAWPAVAQGLSMVRAHRAFEAAGHDTFKAWIAELDAINYRSACEHVQALAFAEEHDICDSDLWRTTPGKLAVVIPAVKRRSVDVAEAISDAQILSRSDLRAKYQGGEPADYTTCEACGNRTKIKELSA
jgi:hypothetical protein